MMIQIIHLISIDDERSIILAHLLYTFSSIIYIWLLTNVKSILIMLQILEILFSHSGNNLTYYYMDIFFNMNQHLQSHTLLNKFALQSTGKSASKVYLM